MIFFCNSLIFFGTIIIALLSLTDEIARKIGYFKNITSLYFKVPTLIIGALMIFIGSYLKDSEAETKETDKEIAHIKETDKLAATYRLEKEKSDSIKEKRIQEIIDSSYLKSIRASNEALAKYNLMLVDSLHLVAGTINTKGSLAQLSIDAVDGNGRAPLYSLQDSTGTFLKIRYISANATSYNIHFTAYILKQYPRDFRVLQYDSASLESPFLLNGPFRTFSMKLDSAILQDKYLYVIILATFSRDNEGASFINYETAYSYNFKDNKFIGREDGVRYSLIIDYLRKHNIPVPLK